MAPPSPTSSHHRVANKQGLQDKPEIMPLKRHPVQSLPPSHPGLWDLTAPSHKGQTGGSGKRGSARPKEEGKSAKKPTMGKAETTSIPVGLTGAVPTPKNM